MKQKIVSLGIILGVIVVPVVGGTGCAFLQKHGGDVLDAAKVACLIAKSLDLDDNAAMKACDIFGEAEGPARRILAEERKSRAAAVSRSGASLDAGTDACR